MKYIKLNKNWNAEPNAPEPCISETDEGIELTFFLNSFLYQHIDDGEKGTLEFFNVYAYRLGTTNDEGQFRFNNKQLPWGEFYELIDSKWNNDFPNDKVIMNDLTNKKSLRHFIFFMKDKTFECIATDFHFKFNDTISEHLEEKYPKGYLNHYLAMFTANFNTPSIDNYQVYTNLYIQMEGIKEFNNLKTEIKNIRKNNDLNLYLKIINYSEIENFGKEQLNEMIKVIETYKNI